MLAVGVLLQTSFLKRSAGLASTAYEAQLELIARLHWTITARPDFLEESSPYGATCAILIPNT